jgi:protein TonB
MRNGINQVDDFDVLLNDVLRDVANAEPVMGLRHKVMMRMLAESEGRLETVESVPPVHVFEVGARQEGVFRSLWNSLRELVMPVKLPPLVLESRPVAVVDRMAVGRGYRSTMWAVGAHALVILVIGGLLAEHVPLGTKRAPMSVTAIELPPHGPVQAIGGGGGQRGPTPVTKGTPPKFNDQQIVPPSAPPMQEPKIKFPPTLEVQPDVQMASSLPQIGLANSPLVGMSMGGGSGTGLGSGNGTGLGPGSGGNTGGGLRHVGGAVSAPVLIFSVEPEFSEEARKAKTAGNVLVRLYVDEKGNPTNVRVIRGIGMGLDEKAVEAVKGYRFKPALENGKPVTVEVNVEVTFHIF